MNQGVISPTTAFDEWAEMYDDQPNPLLLLEERFLPQILPDVQNLDILDAGCGTGRWLQQFAEQAPRTLIGIDSAPGMLVRAKEKVGDRCTLHLGSCDILPVPDTSVDLLLASFVLSYLEDLEAFALEINRVLRPGASLFLTDMHPDTAVYRNWKRSFKKNGSEMHIPTNGWSISRITQTFREHGYRTVALVEPAFGHPERRAFEESGRPDLFDAAATLPAIYIQQFRKPFRPCSASPARPFATEPIRLVGAICGLGSDASVPASIGIEDGKIKFITSPNHNPYKTDSSTPGSIDLSGYLLLPGLVNSHDHLEFALFPNLGHGPYQNSSQWADDIHSRDAALIALHRRVPKQVRLWWGAIRNLLCGVTTVCHHNPIEQEMLAPEFPVHVVSNFGWAHSLSLEPDLVRHFEISSSASPFIVHAAEGIDERSALEIFELDRQGVLDRRTVLVHGLALTLEAASILNERGASLIICPTSNEFLFHRSPTDRFIASIDRVALGSDSPLTAAGDLLDEVRFAHDDIGIEAGLLYEMVTERSAKILCLQQSEGHLRPGAVADLIAVRDDGFAPAETLVRLTAEHVELVIRSGQVQLASPSIYSHLRGQERAGLQLLEVDGYRRWVRAPIEHLVKDATEVLGSGLRLGGKRIGHVAAT